MNRINRFVFSFALSNNGSKGKKLHFLFNTTMPLSADTALPPRWIIAYACMNLNCNLSFSTLYGKALMQKNARDATRNGRDKMRERGRAAAAACVTTSVVTNISSKGEERLLSHEWKDASRNQF